MTWSMFFPFHDNTLLFIWLLANAIVALLLLHSSRRRPSPATDDGDCPADSSSAFPPLLQRTKSESEGEGEGKSMEEIWEMINKDEKLHRFKTSDSSSSSSSVKSNSGGRSMDKTWEAIVKRKEDMEEEKESSMEVRKEDSGLRGVDWDQQKRTVRHDLCYAAQDLNQKVEFFINSFREELRLQRKLSHQRFLEIIHKTV